MAIPSVTTKIASPKTNTCVIRGHVVSSGTNDLIKNGFYFGVAPDSLDTIYEVDVNSGVFDFNVPNLSSGTQYYYNAFAENSLGIGSGITSGFVTGDYTRQPQGIFKVAWNKQLNVAAGSGVSWFRLDQSTLDGPDILASQNYLEDESIVDIIGAWDTYFYSDESEYLISAEGYSEMRGDINQSIKAEADVVLSNSPNPGDPIDAFNRAFGRYTIRENKNKLLNPSYEFLNIPNWTINSYGDVTYSLGNTVLSGLYSLRLYIPKNDWVLVSGAGTDEYNGYYSIGGNYNGKSYYQKRDNSAHYIEWSAIDEPLEDYRWLINDGFSTPLLTPVYIGDEEAEFPANPWIVGSGEEPAPTVSEVSEALGSGHFTIKSDPITVTSGLWYTASIYGLAEGNNTFNLTLVTSGTNGVINSGLAVDNQLSSEWTRYEVSHQMPAGVKTAYLDIVTSVITDSEEIFFDCGQFEQGKPATGYDGGFIGDRVLPKRPAKILVNTDGEKDYPQFTGVTETIEPNYPQDTVHLYMHDLGSELENKEITSNMYKGLTTSQAVELICGEVGLSSGTYIIDDSSNIIDFLWFQEGSAWFYLSNIAEAEGGRVFFSNDGILTFLNHAHTMSSGITSGIKSFDFSDMDNLDWRVDKDEIKNHIIVKSTPREVQDYQLVYTHVVSEEIKAGETKEVWARITDPDRNNEGLPCIGIKQPTGGASGDSTYSVRPNSDGSGANRDSDVTVSSYAGFAESARINFKNNSEDTLYITTLQLYASPAKVTQDIQVEKEDEASILIYGRQTLQIENNFINSRDDAETLATNKLIELKDPRTHLRLSTVGDPSLKLGDVITVQDAKSTEISSGTTQELMVKSIKWSLLDEFKQNIVLEKLVY